MNIAKRQGKHQNSNSKYILQIMDLAPWVANEIKFVEVFSFAPHLGGGNSNIFYVHPYLGKIPILTSIFFRWVGTTN